MFVLFLCLMTLSRTWTTEKVIETQFIFDINSKFAAVNVCWFVWLLFFAVFRKSGHKMHKFYLKWRTECEIFASFLLYKPYKLCEVWIFWDEPISSILLFVWTTLWQKQTNHIRLYGTLLYANMLNCSMWMCYPKIIYIKINIEYHMEIKCFLGVQIHLKNKTQWKISWYHQKTISIF